MDSQSNLLSQAMRYDHLQRLLKQYELEALTSLRGPAGAVDTISIGAATTTGSSSTNGICQSQASTTSMRAAAASYSEKTTSLTSLFNAAASTLCRPNINKPSENMNSSISARRIDDSSGINIGKVTGGGGDRLTSQEQDALAERNRLLKEIISLRGAIPVQPLPVLSAQDRTTGAAERKETLLEGESITCFVVGGEKRLCFPQVLNTVLKNVSMVDINRACTELNIHCGHCTPEQLLVLKIAGVMSATTASCTLITKTDAERLCDYLLRQKRKDTRNGLGSGFPRNGDIKSRVNSIGAQQPTIAARLSSSRQPISDIGSEAMNGKVDMEVGVIHFCFGRCRGRYRQLLYASPSAECIECDECGQLFAPDRFVVHSHGNQERRTCHWGFDSANWRAYLHLTEEDECEQNTKILDEMKLRFDVTGLTKRRFDQISDTVGVAAEMKNITMENATQDNGKRIKLDVPEPQRQLQLPRFPSTSSKGLLINQLNANAVKNDKLPVGNGLQIPTVPGIDQASLSYLLCDPVLFTSYYQAALAAATAATIRAAAATVPQAISNPTTTTNVIPPSLLPHFATPATSASLPLQKQQSLIGGVGLELDGFVSKAGNLPVQQQIRQHETQQLLKDKPLDEATATAALKLLQMHTGNDYSVYGTLFGNSQAKVADVGKDAFLLQNGTSATKSYNGTAASNFGKEPFKKQLLHLFAAEQQQKEQLRQKQEINKLDGNELAKQDDLDRGSVEIVVDDDDDNAKIQKPSTESKLRQTTSSSESEKAEVATPETQVADELSVSSSDNEGANGELSLDELLRRYIIDSDGLKLVRAKIAGNQRYLEQKLDAVTAENRFWHAECLQLRARRLEFQQQQQKQFEKPEQQLAAANFLAKGGFGNLVNLLPKQFSL